jgi:hypothetical protein
MRRLFGSLVALTILATGALAAPQCERSEAKSSASAPPPWTAKQCPIACRVRYSPGGWIDDFKKSALQLKADGRTLIIDGQCISACTVAADLARPNVCITPRASFRFHRTYAWDMATLCFLGRDDAYEDYSADIGGWIRAHGGFPGKTLHDDALLDMNAKEAAAFFPVCGA